MQCCAALTNRWLHDVGSKQPRASERAGPVQQAQQRSAAVLHVPRVLQQLEVAHGVRVKQHGLDSARESDLERARSEVDVVRELEVFEEGGAGGERIVPGEIFRGNSDRFDRCWNVRDIKSI